MKTSRTEPEAPPSILIVTKEELAEALKISVRTLERMVANGDITPLGPPGGRVRFCLPDVMEELRRGKHKFGKSADLSAGSRVMAEGGSTDENDCGD